MIRIFIADDHEIVRSGLRQLFTGERDTEVVGEADSVENLLARLQESRADVLVLDINMPGSPSPGAVRDWLRSLPKMAVVIFTMYPEDSHAVSFLRSGASAYINKRRSIVEVLKAIRAAAKGRRYLTEDLEDYLFVNDIDLLKSAEDILSQREVQVIRKLVDGLRSKEIASELQVSQSTVNTYVQRIKIKLGLKSIVEIVEYARANGLIG